MPVYNLLKFMLKLSWLQHVYLSIANGPKRFLAMHCVFEKPPPPTVLAIIMVLVTGPRRSRAPAPPSMLCLSLHDPCSALAPTRVTRASRPLQLRWTPLRGARRRWTPLRGASRAGKREGSPALKEAKEQEKDQMHREELKTQRDEIEALQQQLEAIKTHTQLEEKKPKEPRTKFLAPSP